VYCGFYACGWHALVKAETSQFQGSLLDRIAAIEKAQQQVRASPPHMQNVDL
jgi:hypothetical protein